MERDYFQLKEKRETAKVFGAVIFIIDENGRVYSQIEDKNNESTGKKANEYSVICETRLPNENLWKNAIRGIKEETGIKEEDQFKVLSEPICWETDGFKDGVWATVFKYECKDPELFMKFVCDSKIHDEVVPVGFLPREVFEKLNLRDGVRNIINRFGDTIFKDGKLDFN